MTTVLSRFGRSTNRPPGASASDEGGAHAWDPARHLPFATAVLRGTRRSRTTTDHDVRTPLATPTLDVLLEQNTRVTALLAAEPGSASAHESAALLVAAFAWREGVDVFSDPRPAMARLTAHLAAADALRGNAPVTLDGALARIVLDHLVGHQRLALDGLGRLALRLTTPAERAWDRAIRLRVTGNWREAEDAAAGLLIERLELARALRGRVGSQAMEAALDRVMRADEAIEWTRLVLTGDFSVGVGRALVESAADAEWDQARRAWRTLNQGAAVPDDLIAALNEAPAPAVAAGGGVRPPVLDWPLWADVSQRQILRSVFGHHRLLGMLSQPRAQATFLDGVKQRYSRFILYPVLLRWANPDAEDQRHARALGRELAMRSPERLTALAWHWLIESSSPASPDPGPAVETWFAGPEPPGTAFDLGNRSLRDGCGSAATTQLQAWAEARPHDRWVLWCHQWRLADGPPPAAAARAAFGALNEYDVTALRQLALGTVATSAERLAALRRMCELSDLGCEDLAQFQVRQGLDAEAAVSFERWLDATPDVVHAANSSAWLVRYYVRTGQLGRAEALARQAGDAFSRRGLQVLAHFLDARGRDAEAEQVYLAIRERYDRADPLGTFLVRRGLRQRDPVQQQHGWSLLRDLFPNGEERIFWHTLTDPPRDGVVFRTFGARVSTPGLRSRDVIVGVDEWRVRTAAQFAVLADLRHDPTMTFTVWRDGRYQQVHAHIPERWMGVELGDYQPR